MTPPSSQTSVLEHGSLRVDHKPEATLSLEERVKLELYRDQGLLIKRKRLATGFRYVTYAAVGFALTILFVLLASVFYSGASWLSWDFLTRFPSRFPERAGIKSAIYGSVWLLFLASAFAVPLGVGAAVYLEEMMPKNRFKQIIDINIANLASVPSIVYGILGLSLFVRFLSLERSVLAGALTLGILVLPIIIIATREALLAVPQTLREAAMALGATRWQTTKDHVLPAALPGIMTGIILSVSRAMGETAPLIMIGALTFIAFVPSGPLDSFTALPIQIFNWTSRPREEFHELAAAGIIVLLVVLLATNAGAIYLRNRAQRKNLCQLL